QPCALRSFRFGWGAAGPQIDGPVPLSEPVAGLSSPEDPDRPLPESRPPEEFVRLSLWDETASPPIHYATSRKSSESHPGPRTDPRGRPPVPRSAVSSSCAEL